MGSNTSKRDNPAKVSARAAIILSAILSKKLDVMPDIDGLHFSNADMTSGLNDRGMLVNKEFTEDKPRAYLSFYAGQDKKIPAVRKYINMIKRDYKLDVELRQDSWSNCFYLDVSPLIANTKEGEIQRQHVMDLVKTESRRMAIGHVLGGSIASILAVGFTAGSGICWYNAYNAAEQPPRPDGKKPRDSLETGLNKMGGVVTAVGAGLSGIVVANEVQGAKVSYEFAKKPWATAVSEAISKDKWRAGEDRARDELLDKYWTIVQQIADFNHEPHPKRQRTLPH